MKLIDARVYWADGYVNDPKFQLLVENDPNCWHTGHACVKNSWYNNPAKIWFLHQNGSNTFAWHMEDGFVNYFYHTPSNQSGYGGATSLIYTKDGLKSFKGPWSSNCGYASKIIGEPIFEGSLTCDPVSFKRGHTFTGSAFTLEIAQQAAKFAGVELVPVEVAGEGNADLSEEQSLAVNFGLPNTAKKIKYMIRTPGKPFKHEKSQKNPPFDYR